jgi:hypothetical protein
MGNENNSFVNLLVKQTQHKSSARYIKRKGQRFKTEEYEYLDSQIKEELEMADPPDWFEVDEILDQLNIQYKKEINPLRREILFVVYTLVVEEHVIVDQIDSSEIKQLYNKLKILYSQLGRL